MPIINPLTALAFAVKNINTQFDYIVNFECLQTEFKILTEITDSELLVGFVFLCHRLQSIEFIIERTHFHFS